MPTLMTETRHNERAMQSKTIFDSVCLGAVDEPEIVTLWSGHRTREAIAYLHAKWDIRCTRMCVMRNVANMEEFYVILA